MWIVSLEFCCFAKTEGLERLEKPGVMKNITYSTFIFQKQNLNEKYIKNEDCNFKVSLSGLVTAIWGY